MIGRRYFYLNHCTLVLFDIALSEPFRWLAVINFALIFGRSFK
jgi:hypothetical protein